MDLQIFSLSNNSQQAKQKQQQQQNKLKFIKQIISKILHSCFSFFARLLFFLDKKTDEEPHQQSQKPQPQQQHQTKANSGDNRIGSRTSRNDADDDDGRNLEKKATKAKKKKSRPEMTTLQYSSQYGGKSSNTSNTINPRGRTQSPGLNPMGRRTTTMNSQPQQQAPQQHQSLHNRSNINTGGVYTSNFSSRRTPSNSRYVTTTTTAMNANMANNSSTMSSSSSSSSPISCNDLYGVSRFNYQHPNNTLMTKRTPVKLEQNFELVLKLKFGQNKNMECYFMK